MKRLVSWGTVGAVVLTLVGCARLTTQVVEKPRLDQELQGNQGYLKGTAPAAGPRRATREVLQTDVELPTAKELNPWKIGEAKVEPAPAPDAGWPAAAPRRVVALPLAPAARSIPLEEWQEPPAPPPPPAPAATTVVVKKGDTLEKIAAKVYGDSSQWRRIYKANKDKLSSPNRLYPGQEIVIPPAEHGKTRGAPSSSDLK